MRRTVKQVAAASGVSVRALHHYHETGLLKPAEVGANGYRYYGRKELLRLQQIMFYRELDFSLSEIGTILDDPSFDLKQALATHREALSRKAERLSYLIQTIDRTIVSLEKETAMSEDDMFVGFSAQKQAEFEDYLADRFGPEARLEIERSKEKMAATSGEHKRNHYDQIAEIEGALSDAMARGAAPDSIEVQRLVTRHHQWISQIWSKPPTSESYTGLAQLYLDHPEFHARFEQIRQGFTEWLARALRAFAEGLPAE